MVVPAWNDAAALPATLSALAAAVEPFDPTRVVVVAGGHDDGVTVAGQRLAEHGNLQGCVRTQRPEGKMAAVADGVQALGDEPPDWLLILDADTHVDPGALEAAVTFLRGRADLVGVGPRLVLDPSGVGAAHDIIGRTLVASHGSVSSVSGGALLLRGEAIWPHRGTVFAPADYPLHVDYQICERATRRTDLAWAYAPGFQVRTPRARGWRFLRAERRHHRAMVARGGSGTPRYLAGAGLIVGLPVVPALVAGTALVPPLWPVGGLAAARAIRRVRRWRADHAAAVRVDPQARDVSFWAYARDEWLFSLTALLGALDHVRDRTPDPRFRGARW